MNQNSIYYVDTCKAKVIRNSKDEDCGTNSQASVGKKKKKKKERNKVIAMMREVCSFPLSSSELTLVLTQLHVSQDVQSKQKLTFTSHLKVNLLNSKVSQFKKSLEKLNSPCSFIIEMRRRSMLPSLKHQLVNKLQCNLVYQINCPGCNSS